MKFYKIVILFLLNLIISVGFYVDNCDVRIQEISTDLANIIPVCKKLDNGNLYQNDLYLNNVDNVKYYTPFYVQSLRFISKFTKYDYLQALNVLGFFTHFVYGTLWFLLFFSLKRDYWLALIFSIFIRGILWPPGGELLGISDLWTIMPRTLFSALIPIPFLVFVYLKKYKLIVAAFSLGLIFNFHPISGIGSLIIYFLFFISYSYLEKQPILSILKGAIVPLLFCFLGMMPFLMTYLTNVNSDSIIPVDLFDAALRSRISDVFFDPVLFLSTWKRPVAIVFGLLFLLFYFFDSSKGKRIFKILLISILGVFVAANLSVYIEAFINFIFNKNLRLSFQLIRFQKFILVIFQLAIFFLTIEVFIKFQIKEKVKVFLLFIYLFFISTSNNSFFNSVPFLSDDLTRLILPSNLQISNTKPLDYSYSLMVDYILKNTNVDAVFYGDDSYFVRAGASRSVVLDSKGASMLIEGNQKQFLQWHLDYNKVESLEGAKLTEFLKTKNVNYFISNKPLIDLILVKKINNVHLYKL